MILQIPYQIPFVLNRPILSLFFLGLRLTKSEEKGESITIQKETELNSEKKYKDPCPCGSGKKYKQCCGK